DPAIAAGCREEFFGVLEPIGENRARQALRHAVMNLNRLVECLVYQHIENGRKRFLLHDRHFGMGVDDGWLNVESRSLESVTATENFATLRASSGDRRLELLNGGFANQWAQQDTVVPRLARLNALVRGNQFCNERVMD